MGTSLGNIHILGTDAERVRAYFPNAITGIWSEGCVSVFSPDFMPGLVDKHARTFSKKISEPVLSAWIFDSDAFGISIFQAGKCVAAHIHNTEGYSKMGNIPLFCKAWSLPDDDGSRLWERHGADPHRPCGR